MTTKNICFPEFPHFISKPSSSITVKEKQNVTLPCKAAGFPPPVITWYKDGNVIEEERRQFKKRNLEIKEIQFEDRGVYTCTAENLLGRIRTLVNVTVKGNVNCITILCFKRLIIGSPSDVASQARLKTMGYICVGQLLTSRFYSIFSTNEIYQQTKKFSDCLQELGYLS